MVNRNGPIEIDRPGRISYRAGRKLDGMRTSDENGYAVRVVGPAWWDIGRWLRLAFDSSRQRIVVSWRGQWRTVWVVGVGSYWH